MAEGHDGAFPSAARSEAGVGKVWPLFGEHQIAQETDAQNGGPAEGCVRDCLESSRKFRTLL